MPVAIRVKAYMSKDQYEVAKHFVEGVSISRDHALSSTFYAAKKILSQAVSTHSAEDDAEISMIDLIYH